MVFVVKKRETVKVLPQKGSSNIKIDAARKALLPGKRISINGKIYWETRKNRSDALYKDV